MKPWFLLLLLLLLLLCTVSIDAIIPIEILQDDDDDPAIITIIQQAIADDTTTDRLQRANLYFQLGNNAQNSPEQAMTSWETAKQLYLELLLQQQQQQQQEDPWIQIGYAMVCIRQGTYLMETTTTTTTTTTTISDAWDLLQTGLHYLEPALHVTTTTSEEFKHLQQECIIAWHNSATAATLLGQFDVALQSLQHVLEYYQNNNNNNNNNHEEEEDHEGFQSMYAEALYSQADLYLQLGQYETAKRTYQQAMDYFQKHLTGGSGGGHYHTEQQQEEQFMEEWQESIQLYETALEEHQQLLQEDPLLVYDYDDYDAFKGDLHATLGALYLSTGEFILSEMHLRQAMLVYYNNNKQQAYRRDVADVRFNLAQLFFQQGNYQESAEQRALACDLYRETVGEGVNPMLSSEEVLMQVKYYDSPSTATNDPHEVAAVDNNKVVTMDVDQFITQWKDNQTEGGSFSDEL